MSEQLLEEVNKNPDLVTWLKTRTGKEALNNLTGIWEGKLKKPATA